MFSTEQQISIRLISEGSCDTEDCFVSQIYVYIQTENIF